MEQQGDAKQEHTVIEMGNMDKETQQFYANSLFPREMQSLTAICDTFLPSITVSSGTKVDENVATFFQASASMAGTPECVGYHFYI